MTNTTNGKASETWMHDGYFVIPVRGSYRRTAGGFCVDVHSDDDRCTLSYWTAPADQVLGERFQPYSEHLTSGH